MNGWAARRWSLITAFLLVAGAPYGAGAQTCVANLPHVDGQWVTLPYVMPINPISATLLHDGRVLIVAGSEYDSSNNSAGSESYRNAVWDPTGTTQSNITVQNIEYDVFCSGTAVLPDGRALIIGGTSDYTVRGDNRASIFDPATSRVLQAQSMADGRWYGSATALGDGRIMAFSGLSGVGSGTVNRTVEVYDLRDAGAGWTSPVSAPFTPPLFPRMALLPTGRVFFTGQGGSYGGTTLSSWIFDPTTSAWTLSATVTSDRRYGSAVLLPLLPPSYTPRVMNFGGGNPATNTTEIIDLSAAAPIWTPGPSMSSGRIQMNAIILPSGKVLAEGGSVTNETPSAAGKQADLYDPVTNTFGSGGTAAYSRLYHSTALLLADATVLTAGSNPSARGKWEPAIEIYTPAYLFDANDQLITTNRPAITSLTTGPIAYGAPFSVGYTSTSPISSVVLMRPGSATHAFDMEQRLVGLCGPSPQPPCSGASPGTLDLVTPPNGNVAPPGYYMLFLLDSAGVPSKAQFIQLSPYASPPPRGAITSPASDTTIAAGSSVFFGTTAAAAQYSWVFPGGSPSSSVAQTPGNVTFGTPGSYVASLTTIDASGNSDPSPPTRTITVTPPTADFEIAVNPSSNPVTPGQSAAFTVTVTPIAGFTGTVNLSVGTDSGLPGGATSGGFTPPSITGAGSSTLTVNTNTSASPFATSLTISGTAGTITHTGSTTLIVKLASPASLAATAGDTQVSLSWPSVNAATSYHVKRATTSGGPYVTVACTTATSYTDTGLVDGTTYYYTVSSAFTGGSNGGGESANSGEVSATPQGTAMGTTTTTTTPPTSSTTTTVTTTTVTTTTATTTTAVIPTTTTATTATATTASTTTTTTSTTTTVTVGGSGSADWGPSFVAWWPLDEASGPRAQATGTCGPSCNLPLASTSAPGNDTTNMVQGTAALNLLAASGQYVGCNQQTTCTALNPSGGSSFAWGAWLRPHTLGATRAWMRNRQSGSGFFGVLGSGNAFMCVVCNATGCGLSTSNTLASADTYYHVVCTFTAGTNSVQTYVNGSADGSPGSHAMAAATSTNFTLGADSGTTWNGRTDEAFFYSGTLGATSICRITSCGIDGTLCACDATTPANYKACTSNGDCGGTAECDVTSGLCQGRRHATPGGAGCPLPVCNQATP